MTITLNRALVAFIRAGLSPLTVPAEMPTPTADAWRALVQHAQRENMSALLYAALTRTGHLAQLPADLAKTLRLTYLRANVAHWRTIALTQELLEWFDAAQIPVVLLKGAALSVTLYTDGALRQIGDLDLLIHDEDKTRVAALLHAHGFTPLLDLTTGFREGLGSEQTYTRRGKHALTVDAHWHIINVPSYAQRTSVAWFWERTLTTSFGARAATVLNWDAQLLHLAEHFVLHHQMRGTRWECDLALVLAAHGNELHWDAILAAARQFRIAPALAAALTQVASVWGVAVPDAVGAQLASTGNLASRVDMLAATAERPDILILREGLSYRRWRDKVAYLFHFIFPSPAYMRQRYLIAHTSLVPFYYGWRLILGAQRIVISVRSILHNTQPDAKGLEETRRL
ncbi:MAG: nucleotidyltransferase family protein [Chloroflexi bacterium]|nr:nucleotidyltransferase family protein [Chloroflexota bacterium]